MGRPNKKTEEKNTLWQKFVAFIPVWVQIIVCIGGVAIVISPLIFQEFFLEKTPTPIFVTSTSEALLPTEMVTLTSQTEQIPLPASDWVEDCIDSRIWIPYLAGEGAQGHVPCYELSESGITAENGKLIFVSNTSQSRAVEYGIFTPWQNWKQIDFSVQAKDLENSEIWLGVFEGDTVDSKGIVFVIQPGDDIDIRELPRENYPVDNTYLPFAGGKFNVNITLSGGKMKFLVDGQGIISDWPVKFTIRNMFIGYRSLPNTLIDATIYNLNLTK